MLSLSASQFFHLTQNEMTGLLRNVKGLDAAYIDFSAIYPQLYLHVTNVKDEDIGNIRERLQGMYKNYKQPFNLQIKVISFIPCSPPALLFYIADLSKSRLSPSIKLSGSPLSINENKEMTAIKGSKTVQNMSAETIKAVEFWQKIGEEDKQFYKQSKTLEDFLNQPSLQSRILTDAQQTARVSDMNKALESLANSCVLADFPFNMLDTEDIETLKIIQLIRCKELLRCVMLTLWNIFHGLNRKFTFPSTDSAYSQPFQIQTGEIVKAVENSSDKVKETVKTWVKEFNQVGKCLKSKVTQWQASNILYSK